MRNFITAMLLVFASVVATHIVELTLVHDALIQEKNEQHQELMDLRVRFKGCKL